MKTVISNNTRKEIGMKLHKRSDSLKVWRIQTKSSHSTAKIVLTQYPM